MASPTQLSDLALDHYSDRQKLVSATSEVAGQMWSDVDPKRIVESWAEQVPELTAVVSGAQLGAARPAASYTDESLAAEGSESGAVAEPDPQAFAGHAADGRGLASLLTNPVFVTLASIQDGFDILSAMSHGRHNLDMIVATEVADAGRLADQVSITSRLRAHGYTRIAVGNSCARCLLLAGKEYRWSAGFLRHPKCDCIHIPTGIARAGLRSLDQDPRLIYDRMTAAERTRAGFTKADQKAIADGADINQVVNAKRGMYTTGGRKLTNESTTRRGVVKRRQRLSVDECYRVAAGDRDEALALLRQNGYLFDGGPKVVEKAIPLPVAAAKDPALSMRVADLKTIARQNNVPIAGLTKKEDIVARLREFETSNGRLAGLPEFTRAETTTVQVPRLSAPSRDVPAVTGQATDSWASLVPEKVPPDGLRVRDMELFPTAADRSYLVANGTVFRDPNGVLYLVEHEADEFGSQRVAKALAEMRAAHDAIPAAARANKSYAYLTRENPYDEYFRLKYNDPTHTASMSAFEGQVTMWNRAKWPRVNVSEVRHETGHNLDTLVGRSAKGSKSKAWSDAANADGKTSVRIDEFDSKGRITREVDASRDWPGGVTSYGKSSAAEDYAESVMMYQLGPIAKGKLPGEASARDLYFRDIFPERAKILDREFPELAEQQKAAVEALRLRANLGSIPTPDRVPLTAEARRNLALQRGMEISPTARDVDVAHALEWDLDPAARPAIRTGSKYPGFDEGKAKTFRPQPEEKTATVVVEREGQETTIRVPQWGDDATQDFTGTWVRVQEPDGSGSYGSAYAEWLDMHERVPGTTDRWRKVATVDAYQAKGGEQIRTILANGKEEVARTAKPGQWIVRQKNGEVQIVDDAKFRRLYMADQPAAAGTVESAARQVVVESPRAPLPPLSQARAQFTRQAAESAKGANALKAVPLRKTQPGDTHIFEGFDALPAADRKRIQDSLIQYERSGSTPINSYLRTGKVRTDVPFAPTEAELKAMIADFRQAFDASKLQESVTVYRGLETGQGVFGPRADWPDDLSGFEWTEGGFFSTSADKRVAESFGEVQLRIVVPEGNPALVLSGMGREFEAEILLPPGMRFRVVKDRGVVGGKRSLDVEVVPAEAATVRTAVVATKATKAAKPPVEVAPEQQIRNLLAGKGTAPRIPTSGPLADGYAGATLDELRVLAESRYGHLGKIAPKASREQLLAALRSEVDLTDLNVMKREAARLLQLRVERGQALADILAEAAEQTFKRATPEAMRRSIEAIARQVTSARTPVPPAFLQGVLKAAQAGDRAKVEVALRRLGQKYKIRLDGMAGDVSKFREGMEATVGGGLRPDLEGRIAGLSADPEVRAIQIENRIRAAYAGLHNDQLHGGWVGLADLRDRIGTDVPRADVDAALERLLRERGAKVAPSEFQSTFAWTGRKEPLTERDRAAALHIAEGAAPRNMISFRIDGQMADLSPRGLPSSAARAVEVRITRPGATIELPTGETRLRNAVVREVDAQERARIRQEAIDEVRKRAEVLTEVNELVANGASKSVLKERLDIRLKRVGLDADPDLKAFVRAVESGDPAKIAKASQAVAKKLNLSQVDEAGALSVFDPKRFQAIAGDRITQGAQVRIVRPGFEYTLNGEKISLSRPVVEALSDAEVAQIRRQAVDTAGALVNLVTEAVGGPAQRRIAIEAAQLPDDIKAALLAASRVSPAKLKTTLTAQMKKSGVTVAKAPKTPVKFDPALHEVKGGAKLPVGTKVRVVEPEVTVTYRGETIVVRKAVVEAPSTFRSAAAPDLKTLIQGSKDPEPALRRAIEGKYAGGVTAKVTDVGHWGGTTITVEGTLHDQGGTVIGAFERKFQRNADGKWEAHHSVLRIDLRYQGSGFAAEFNGNLYDWYRRSGFDMVTLDANIDVGGYAWATQGFDFADVTQRRKIIKVGRTYVDDMRARSDAQMSHWAGGADPDEIKAQLDLFDALERRALNGEEITAYELSQLGRKPGQGKNDWWVGKALMLGSHWEGVKLL